MAEKGIKKTYAVVGASGNTGREVAEQLLASGKKVRVIGRNADHLKGLVDKGAEPFVASIEDKSALTEAFSGIQAVCSMTPLDMAVEDPFSYPNRIGKAIGEAHIPYLVNMSSMAATSDRKGFTCGLYNQEQRLNRLLDRINVVQLRPPFFMENFLASINAIKKAGIIAYPAKPDISFPMITAKDLLPERCGCCSVWIFRANPQEHCLDRGTVLWQKLPR